MKSILVLTDFSARADHIAHYALKLAQKVKANLLLCNVFPVPAEPAFALAAWPTIGHDGFEVDSINSLNELTARLNKKLDTILKNEEFRPVIHHCSEAGSIAETINKITSDHNLLMAVVGMHSADGLTTFLLGDHASEIIENAKCPVLVVPYQFPFKNFKKISFATDLTHTSNDILYSLNGLTRHFDSEVLITHVTDDDSIDIEQLNSKPHFVGSGINGVNFPKVQYRTIKNKSVIAGLDWLTEHTDIDLLVLVHRKRNFFQKIFEGSVTQKLADHLTKPMLVFPGSRVHKTLPVF